MYIKGGMQMRVQASIPELSYPDRSPEDILNSTRFKYSRVVREIREPQFAFWEITHACNLRCAHCGVAAGIPGEDELSTGETFALLDNISESGTDFIMLLGGEPLVREDILEIVAYASKRFCVLMCTNGTLLDREYTRRLQEAGVWYMGISLDGASARTHDSVRGEGSYERTLTGIRNCVDAGFPVCLMATISKLNISELPDMLKLGSDLRASDFAVRDFIPCGRGGRITHLALSKEERRLMCEYLAARRAETGPLMMDSALNDTRRSGFTAELPMNINLPDEPYWFITLSKEYQERRFDIYDEETCIGDVSGIISYGIKPNGDVVPYPGIEVPIGDLKAQSFSEIWADSDVLKQLRNRRNLGGKCGRCEYKYVCGGSRAASFQLRGDMMAEDPRCWYEPMLY